MSDHDWDPVAEVCRRCSALRQEVSDAGALSCGSGMLAVWRRRRPARERAQTAAFLAGVKVAEAARRADLVARLAAMHGWGDDE